MSYAVILDVPTSWERYRRIAAVVLEPVPAGLIAYAAGRTDEGVRAIGIWHDEASWRSFEAAWTAQAASSSDGIPVPTPVRRDLHAEQLVVPADTTRREMS